MKREWRKTALLASVLAFSWSADRAVAGDDIEIYATDFMVGRAAVDNLACDLPAIGSHCLIVPCAACNATIPDAPSQSQIGFLNRGIIVTDGDLAALGVDTCIVERVEAAVEITHPFVGDLLVGLVRDETIVSLYQPNVACDDGDGFDGVFGDLGPAPRNQCPFETGGGILSDESLEAFAGEDVVGIWSLAIQDAFPADFGTLERAPDTGYFWFFNEENVELIVKVLAGCPITNHWWVFAGGLTDVEVTLRVRDTETEEVKTYFNPQKQPFQPVQDTSAFATCP